MFATPPTALPEEDPAESDTGETPDTVDEETQTPDDKTPAAAEPPSPTSRPMPLSPPPLPLSPSRPGQRRGSADLLSVTHPGAGVSRRPSLPVYSSDRSPGHVTDRSPGHVLARPGATSPIQLPVNGVHRPSRVAAALAWSDRRGVRQTARDLLDPRRLPEATARHQESWEDDSTSGLGELVSYVYPCRVMRNGRIS